VSRRLFFCKDPISYVRHEFSDLFPGRVRSNIICCLFSDVLRRIANIEFTNTKLAELFPMNLTVNRVLLTNTLENVYYRADNFLYLS